MNIIVVGCGRVGAEIAYSLFRQGKKVAVIDQDSAAFRNLPPDFRGITIEGEVLALDVLVRAGIEHAHALAAVTPSDSFNAVVGHIARSVYKVPNVVVRNYEPRKRSLHDAFELPVISPSTWGAERISQILSAPPSFTVHGTTDGLVEVIQISVPKTWHGRPLKDVVPQECAGAAVTRAGRSFMAGAADLVEAGDTLIVIGSREGIASLKDQLEGEKGT